MAWRECVVGGEWAEAPVREALLPLFQAWGAYLRDAARRPGARRGRAQVGRARALARRQKCVGATTPISTAICTATAAAITAAITAAIAAAIAAATTTATTTAITATMAPYSLELDEDEAHADEAEEVYGIPEEDLPDPTQTVKLLIHERLPLVG